MSYMETKRFHIFSKEELSRMVRLGDLEEKAILLLGKDLGIKVNDFIELKRSPILEAFKHQKGNFPIEFEIETRKGVTAIGHIMPETWEALQNYWSSKPQSEYAFSSDGSPLSEDRINYIIKKVWNRAYPDRQYLQTRFNEIRNFKMTALRKCGINEWHIKRMMGKKLSSDISAYLRNINLKKDFRKAMPQMLLSSLFAANQEKTEELTLMQIEKETQTLRTQVDDLQNNIVRLEQLLDDNIQIKKASQTFKTQIDNLQNNIERLEQLLRDNQIEFQFITTKINDRLDWLEIQTKKKEVFID